MSQRYKGHKGKLWEIFSVYIRLRDFLVYGYCVSCFKHIEDWKMCDAGHFVPAGEGGIGLLFDEKNVHLQCKRCNNPKWSPAAAFPFSKEVDRRLGEGTADSLWARKWETNKDWTKAEYQVKIDHYKRSVQELMKKL